GSRGSWHAGAAAARPPVALSAAVGAGTGARDRSVAAPPGPHLAGGPVPSGGDERTAQWDDGVSPLGWREPVWWGPAGGGGAARPGPHLAGGPVRSVGDERTDQWDDGVSPRGGAEPVRVGPAGGAGIARPARVGTAGGPQRPGRHLLLAAVVRALPALGVRTG